MRQKSHNQFLFLVLKLKHHCICHAKALALTFWWPSTNKITGTHQHHKLLLYSSWHVPSVVGSRHKSGTENNQDRQRTTPWYNWCYNRKYCHSKRNYLLLLVISVSRPFNNSVINPPQLSSVFQQSSRFSNNTPRDNRCFNSKDSNSNRNELPSPVIPVPPPLNDSVSNTPQLSLFRQQS